MIRRFAALAAVIAAGLASTVHAADLIIDETATPGIVEASGDWDGVFVGGFAGYAGGAITDPAAMDLKGWLLGVNAGANFTLGEGIVAGIVGDIAWSNITDDEMIQPPGAFDVNWAGSIRGRVGYDAGALLPYLTAGLAVASATLFESINGDEVDTNLHLGWTVGAGVEFKATDDLSVDLAYRYSDYGAAAYDVTDWDFATHQISVGLNWHF
jgi:opacity protein-like surface antigen